MGQVFHGRRSGDQACEHVKDFNKWGSTGEAGQAKNPFRQWAWV